ncbi:hypothetical protein FT663_00877 [Candidozyma haemuli var. vulneris]|nr:hypothetical protein FT662_01998 [[Candida] haemuloni var. vulneris]KAF3995041.1 hypothetical protein FT663_00877 [[Candida] haemuloni var. vulneris]
MEDLEAQLKASVYLSVAKMVEEQTNEMSVSASPSFIASLVEIVYNQIVSLGTDLELFADHAGRNVIKPADMYMVSRKNETLTNALKEYEKAQEENNSK